MLIYIFQIFFHVSASRLWNAWVLETVQKSSQHVLTCKGVHDTLLSGKKKNRLPKIMYGIIPLTLKSRSIFLWILKGGKVLTKLLTQIISGSKIMVLWDRELLPSFHTSLLFEFFKMHVLLLWSKYVFNHFWLTTFCGIKFKLLSSTESTHQFVP